MAQLLLQDQHCEAGLDAGVQILLGWETVLISILNCCWRQMPLSPPVTLLVFPLKLVCVTLHEDQWKRKIVLKKFPYKG